MLKHFSLVWHPGRAVMAKQQKEFLSGLTRLTTAHRDRLGGDGGAEDHTVVLHLMSNSRHEVTLFAHCWWECERAPWVCAPKAGIGQRILQSNQMTMIWFWLYECKVNFIHNILVIFLQSQTTADHIICFFLQVLFLSTLINITHVFKLTRIWIRLYDAQ